MTGIEPAYSAWEVGSVGPRGSTTVGVEQLTCAIGLWWTVGDEPMPPHAGQRATGAVMVFVGVVAPRGEAPTELPSWRRLSDRDVCFEGKRSRQQAVAIPLVPMRGSVTKPPPPRRGRSRRRLSSTAPK
jgi:hypothetical protein